jgi:hypothetical protein
LKLRDTRKTWEKLSSWGGRYKKFEVNISEKEKGIYYFYVNRKEDDIRYNCLWDNITYTSVVDVEEAVVKWIDNKLKEITSK